MTEFIPMELQVSAVALAEEASFSTAARRLGTNMAILHARIGELTAILEYPLFREDGDRIEVTPAGQILIAAFRSFLERSAKEEE